MPGVGEGSVEVENGQWPAVPRHSPSLEAAPAPCGAPLGGAPRAGRAEARGAADGRRLPDALIAGRSPHSGRDRPACPGILAHPAC